MHGDLPLFAWQPPCQIILFPLTRRVGKIRDVASKLLDKATDRHADYYRSQVNEGLVRHLEKAGLPWLAISEELSKFWHLVDLEAARLLHRDHRPGGDAA